MSEQYLDGLISACEKEPIHIPGAVQPFGAILAYSPYFSELCHASANAQDILSKNCWQEDVQSLFSPAVIGRIVDALQVDEVFFDTHNSYALTAYVSHPYWVLEVESLADFEIKVDAGDTLNKAYASLRRARSPADLLTILSREFQRLSGFERVMIYHFDVDWHGQVIAEAIGNRLPSMLGHHFPASDLPVQARAAYSKNSLRIIPSSDSASIAMQSAPDATLNDPVDMSLGNVRAVSPVHMQYLQNLGVAASCSVGLFNEDKLWGLVACHHSDEVRLHPQTRELLKLIVEFASQRYFLLEAREKETQQRRIQELRDALLSQMQTDNDLNLLLTEHGPGWLRLLNCCGCVLVQGNQFYRHGDVPGTAQLSAIASWLTHNVQHRPYWSSELYSQSISVPAGDDQPSFPGLLAVPGRPGDWLLLFRKEHVAIKRWAGKPEKNVYQGITGDMLGPRKSFSIWQQRVEGRSLYWHEYTLQAGRDIGRDLLLIANANQISNLS